MHRLILILCLYLTSCVPTHAADRMEPMLYICSNEDRIVYVVKNDLSFTLFDGNGHKLTGGFFNPETTKEGGYLLVAEAGEAAVGFFDDPESRGQVLLIAFSGKKEDMIEFRCR